MGLSSPGNYVHFSIFQVSEANLVLIAVMVVIFGAALLLPFPDHRRGRGSGGADASGAGTGGAGTGGGARAGTA
jgi:hypothetical protein